LIGIKQTDEQRRQKNINGLQSLKYILEKDIFEHMTWKIETGKDFCLHVKEEKPVSK